MQHYYKSSDATLVASLTNHFDDLNTLRNVQNKFAKRFGAVAMHSTMDERFLGVFFKTPPKEPALWTRPTRHGMRTPKRTGGGEAGEKLRDLWNKHLPTGHLVTNVFLDALDQPQFSPGRSMGYGLVGKAIYIAISTPLKDKRLTEIVASEYMKATKAHA